MESGDEVRVVHNPQQLRYELWEGASLAGVIDYRVEPDAVVFVHTEVDPAFEGRGLGTRLVASALDDLRARGLNLIALCPFVTAFIRRHPDYADLDVTDVVRSD